MAIYNFKGKVLSRSQGRNVVSAAAYRAAEKLHDDRTDQTFDFTRKQDVAFTEIFLPDNAPLKFKERETLWNTVEFHEKRKDSQLAREFIFSLPRELTIEQNIQLAKEFVKEAFVSQGMIADLCVHNDKASDGERNPHGHVMLTLREVNENGFGKKVREWNEKPLLLSWREMWADIANQHLALHGHDIVIDHRSLEDQGIGLEPQHQIGPTAYKGHLANMADHARIARENGEKLLVNPDIALQAITRQQSTFTHQDLARFVNRHTADAEQFSLVYEKIKLCDDMVPLGLDEKGRERFTTREMLGIESKMMSLSLSLVQQDTHFVGEIQQAQALSQRSLSDEQKTAFDHLVGEGDLKCVVGFAGTGKSYLLGAAREAWESQGFTVLGVTLSGIAAENLEGSSGIESRTFASRSYYWDKGEQSLSKNDVLVVDEAGMLSSRQMGRLMEEACHAGAKVVLVGDPQQLQAIEAGAAFRAIAEKTGFIELTDIRRQALEWQREATQELARGEVGVALYRYNAHSHVHEFETKEVAKSSLVDVWNAVRIANPDQTQIMLAYNRSDVAELNQMARLLRHVRGELGQDVFFQTGRGEKVFAERDRVYFLKNDRPLGVMNGSLGTIESIQEGTLTIAVDTQKGDGEGACHYVSISMGRYDQIDHGYAATVHKAQGVTVDRSFVLASPYLDAHSTYVAMSRHRQSADLFYGKDNFPTQDDLIKTLSRDHAKDVSLDYLSPDSQREFGEWRGTQEEKLYSLVDDTVQTSHDQTPVLSKEDERLMRQAKLREFTERSHQERAAARSIGPDSSFMNAREKGLRDLSDFKRQYEAKHRISTKELTQDIELQRLENDVEKNNETHWEKEHSGSDGRVEKEDLLFDFKKDSLEKFEDMSREKEGLDQDNILKNPASMEKEIGQDANDFQKERGFELEL